LIEISARHAQACQDSFGMRLQRSLVALTFLLAANACGGRQAIDQSSNDHPAASGGSAGAANTGAGGDVGQGGSSTTTSSHRCAFGTMETAPTVAPSSAPDVVQARILRFLFDGSVQPSLPPTNGPGWAAATATQILDAATRGDARIPPGFVRWLTSWTYDGKPPATLQLWAYEISRPDSTLSTLIATPKEWSAPHALGYMTDVDILTVRSSIDRRGMMILGNLFCSTIPAAPAGFITTPPSMMPGITDRMLHQQAIDQAVCAACHKLMDRPGHAFEHFDRNAKYRDLDNGVPVDASDEFTFPGGDSFKFTSINDLAPQLAVSCEVARCVASSLLWIAIEPDHMSNADPPFGDTDVIPIANAFADSGFSIRALVRSIVEAPAFQR
jgi:hypothetical protein